ncbi:hypothetical protein QTP86_008444, partial [Hemibagrus guttatus]
MLASLPGHHQVSHGSLVLNCHHSYQIAPP